MANGSAIRAGRAYVEFFADDSELVKGMRKAEKSVRDFGNRITAIGATLAAASAAVLAPLGVAVRQFAAQGDQLDKMSLRTGVAAEELSTLGFAAERNGSSIEKLGQTLFRMNRRIANAATGTGPAVRALQELNIEAASFSKLSADRQFKQLSDALKGLRNPALAAQYAFEIFGDGARDLMPLIKQGSAEIEKLQAEARAMGLEFSQGDAAKAAQLTDMLGDLKSTVTAVSREIGAALADTLIDLATRVRSVVQSVGQWISDNRDLVVTIAKVAAVVGAVGATLVTVGTGIVTLAATIKSVTIVMTTLSTVAASTQTALTALAATVTMTKVAIGGLIAAAGVGLVLWLRSLNKEATNASKAMERLQGVTGSLQAAGNQASRARARQSLAGGDAQATADAIGEEIQALREAQIALQQMEDATKGGGYVTQGTALDLQASSGIKDMLDKADKHYNLAILAAGAVADKIEGGASGTGYTIESLAKQVSARITELEQSRKDIVTAAETAVAEPDRIAQGLTDEIQLLKIRSIEDPLARELALTNDHYDKMLRDARDYTSDRASIEEARELALQQIRKRYAQEAERDSVAEKKRKLDDAQRSAEAVRNLEQGIKDEIARLTIEVSTPEGAERNQQMLELERDIALRNARDSGVDPRLIEQQFDLRQQAMDANRNQESSVNVMGTFSATHLNQILGASTVDQRIASSTEETAQNTKQLLRHFKDNPSAAVFG